MTSQNPMGLPQDEYDRLIKDYKEALVNIFAEIEKAIEDLKHSPSKENMKELHLFVHRFAGNSGTYGYMKASGILRLWEQELIQLLENYMEGILGKPFFNRQIELLSQVRHAIK